LNVVDEQVIMLRAYDYLLMNVLGCSGRFAIAGEGLARPSGMVGIPIADALLHLIAA